MCHSEKASDKAARVASEMGAGQRHRNIATYYGAEDKWKLMLEEVEPDMVFIALISS